MNYIKIYNNIINNALLKNRIKTKRNEHNHVYYEKHHINPKCLGGSNNKENLVLLTAREHFICHKLLILIYPKNKSLIYALHRMTYDKINGRKISSKDYEHEKILFNSIPVYKSLTTRQNMSKARKGKSYIKFYKENAENMKLKRKLQTKGKGNPNAKKYIIHNIILNKYWFCFGNLNKFCSEYHVSDRTMQLSRKNNIYINNWRCFNYDDSFNNYEIYL